MVSGSMKTVASRKLLKKANNWSGVIAGMVLIVG
jgi:hypothetical protein